MPNPVLRSLRSLSNASPEARKAFFRCARHLTVNRQIYPQLAAPISVKTPPIPAAKLASTEFDGKFDGGFCGTYGACRTEVRLTLCGWTPRRYSTSPVSRAAPYTPLNAAFQLHGRVCGYALTHRLARAVFHPSVGCVPSRLRWTHWTFALNAVGQGDIRRLILPRRAGQAPPLHYRVVGSPDRLGTLYVCGSPHAYRRNARAFAPCGCLQRPSALPKGLCPLDSHTRRREARVLGQAVAALPSSPTPEPEAWSLQSASTPFRGISSPLRGCGIPRWG